MALFAAALALSSLAVGTLAEWKPADGLQELDSVEDALHKVEHAKLSPEQHKLSMHAVEDVEQIVAQIKTNQSLTTAQKKEKVKSAILELQGLQSQWELAAVEGSLSKLLEAPHLSPEQRKAAKRVAAEVDSVVEAIEAGSLKGEAKMKKVAFAIKELSGLEQSMTNSSAQGRLHALQAEIAEKKALLKEDEAKLKLAGLEKKLLETQGEMKKLQAQKDQAENVQKDRREDAAQQAMVSKLLGMAKALVDSKKPQAKVEEHAVKPAVKAHTNSTGNATVKLAVKLAVKAHTNSTGKAISGLDPILESLRTRAQNVSGVLATMDTAETKRKAQWKREPDSKIMQAMHKKMSRSYRQVRAVKASELRELNEAIRGIEQGDTVALAKVMSQMQAEEKALNAKSKNFLY